MLVYLEFLCHNLVLWLQRVFLKCMDDLKKGFIEDQLEGCMAQMGFVYGPQHGVSPQLCSSSPKPRFTFHSPQTTTGTQEMKKQTHTYCCYCRCVVTSSLLCFVSEHQGDDKYITYWGLFHRKIRAADLKISARRSTASN